MYNWKDSVIKDDKTTEPVVKKAPAPVAYQEPGFFGGIGEMFVFLTQLSAAAFLLWMAVGAIIIAVGVMS